jgi:glycosyltransferase involved in cell wall biosynthesis
MRVGQFTDSYPPIVNGVSAFVGEHHLELLMQGHDAHVFTFGYTDELRTGANVHRTRGVPLFNSHFRANVRFDGAIERIAQSLQVFHTHEATMAAGWAALDLARRYRKPLIFTNHTRHDLYVNTYPRIMQPFLHTYVQRIIAHAIRNSDLVTAPSQDTAHWLRSLAPDSSTHIDVVRNGIRLDEAEVDDVAHRPKIRQQLGIPSEATVFIYIGRLSHEKNLAAFAEAFANIIQQKSQDAHWLVVGDGVCRPDLEARTACIRQRVHFVGKVPHLCVRQYLAAADVFATTSLSEVNPVSVIEALACAKPYLGLRAAWWDEFAGPTAGVLCDDVAQLSRAIVRLSDDDNGAALRREMSQHALHLSRNFDIRNVTAQWQDVYARVLERWPYASCQPRKGHAQTYGHKPSQRHQPQPVFARLSKQRQRNQRADDATH